MNDTLNTVDTEWILKALKNASEKQGSEQFLWLAVAAVVALAATIGVLWKNSERKSRDAAEAARNQSAQLEADRHALLVKCFDVLNATLVAVASRFDKFNEQRIGDAEKALVNYRLDKEEQGRQREKLLDLVNTTTAELEEHIDASVGRVEAKIEAQAKKIEAIARRIGRVEDKVNISPKEGD